MVMSVEVGVGLDFFESIRGDVTNKVVREDVGWVVVPTAVGDVGLEVAVHHYIC